MRIQKLRIRKWIMGVLVSGTLMVGMSFPALLNSTATPVLSTSTPDPLTLASTPVTRNQDWVPVTQDFDGVTMVLVPSGSFVMGSTSAEVDAAFAACQAASNNICVRSFFERELIPPEGNRQTLIPFWIDQTEVTQADFERIGGVKAATNYFDGDERPVEQITWFEARDFCAARGMRLPTEAEWEYAARGPEGLVYPWGNDWNPDNALWRGNSNNETAAVGSRPAGASWVGALDMSGNVYEWVSSLYQPYPYDDQDGREDLDNRTDIRVLRGGSWYIIFASNLRAANRTGNIRDYSDLIIGFRCAFS